MKVKDVMSTDPVTVDEGATVREAIDLLFNLEIRHLPVTADGRLVGIVTDRDVRQLTVPISWNESVVAEVPAGEPNPADDPVTTVMSGGVVAVTDDTSLAHVVDLFCDHKYGALPVVDDRQRLVGIVSYVDLLRALRPAD